MPDYPASILHALRASRDRHPEKPCLLFEGEAWTYRRLWDEAARWAGALTASGIRPGERVALYLDSVPEFVAAYLGIQMAGAIVVLVNTQYRQVELRHILSDAEVRLCVADLPRWQELQGVEGDLPALEAVALLDTARGRRYGPVGQVSPTARRVCVIDAHDLPLASGQASHELPSPGAIAVIGYTSGTTGRSKGAALSHGNLASNCWAVTTAWRWTERDTLLLALPLFHVHGLCVGIHGTLLTGGTADLRRMFDAAEVYDALLRGGPTMFFGVPTMYTRLIAAAKSRAARPAPLRLYVSGSAPLSAQTFLEFERLFGQRILERYGMTETIMNLTNPYDGERRPGTVGGPFPGQEARIVDVQSRQPVLDEGPGEIQVRGPHVFGGYWRQPGATAEAFDGDGWFNTGDLGWRSADGYYTISGRARELIITGGYNVYPREVEEVLLLHPGVAEAAVFGMPDAEFGERVVATVVRREPEAPGVDELVAWCRDRLASFKKPRRVEFVDALPRNALGKVQKHLLRERLDST